MDKIYPVVGNLVVCKCMCVYNVQPAGRMNHVRSIVNCQLVHLPRFFERVYSKRAEQLTTLTSTLAALPQQTGIVQNLCAQMVMVLLFVLYKSRRIGCTRFVFEILLGPNRAWLLVDYDFTPRPLFSLHRVIYVTWCTRHIPEPDCGSFHYTSQGLPCLHTKHLPAMPC